jgi:hypothetical protein
MHLHSHFGHGYQPLVLCSHNPGRICFVQLATYLMIENPADSKLNSTLQQCQAEYPT